MRVAVQAASLALVGAVAASVPAAAQGADGFSRTSHKGTFGPVKGGHVPRAVTYDERLVPKGARIKVVDEGADGATRISLRVAGVARGHHFGAHVHTKPCGPKPDDSGPHYQNVRDPHQPSTDPKYANPRNEVWLDFTSGLLGHGESSAVQRWKFRAGQARSLVLHEHGTETGPGHAGQAGDRVACFSVPFGESRR
ncbi:superoxide dismutase family protein [Streptomyces sulphureus]|uniref:superoxide dismutase family protein n=1 Tax=Streptomyces sulphureus TaxID=47758 RepID=UPI0003AA1D15|nr:superoxide dismutase family protein [Streptomyces sulphureus]